MVSAPRVLVVQLKRFMVEGMDSKSGRPIKRKIHEMVEYSEQWTLLEHNYQLVNVVVHEGELDKGHYYSYGRGREQWRCFNDASVGQLESIVTRHAYLLVYQLREE